MKTFLNSLLNIFKISFKIVLVLVIAYTSFSYLSRVFYNREVERELSFHSLPENTMDVIVLGSSHAEYSFVPHFFYQETGLYSYVLGTACQPLEVSYQMLRESLKTQNPKAVILEVYTAMPLRSICEDDSCYVLGEYQMTGEEKYNTINYLPKEKAKTYYNDFINYHNDWKTTRTLNIFKPENMLKTKGDDFSEDFGYIFKYAPFDLPEKWYPAQVHDSSENLDVKLDELDLESLNNIKKLCDEENIQLILYKTPIDGIDIENQSYLHKVWEWAEDNNVPYYDFVAKGHDLGFYMWIHSDSFHCYVNGAGLITENLASFVNDLNIDFNHQENQRITEKLIGRGQFMLGDYISGEMDPLKYLKLMDNFNGYVFFRYNPTAYKVDDELLDLLSKMGFKDKFDPNKPFFAILKDNELLVYDTNPFEHEIDNHKITISYDGITIDDVAYINADCKMSLVYSDYNFIAKVNKVIEYRGKVWQYDVQSYIIDF